MWTSWTTRTLSRRFVQRYLLIIYTQAQCILILIFFYWYLNKKIKKIENRKIGSIGLIFMLKFKVFVNFVHQFVSWLQMAVFFLQRIVQFITIYHQDNFLLNLSATCSDWLKVFVFITMLQLHSWVLTAMVVIIGFHQSFYQVSRSCK